MKSEMIPFFFRSREVRGLTIDGEPWFVAKDVCDVLDIQNPTDAVKSLDDDERMTLDNTEGHSGKRGGARAYNIISESGLYALVFKSRKPEAKAFRKWVTAEVLPALRRRGHYETPTRRRESRADIFHHRGPVSESGLDIRYALDLTRIALNPTPRTLALVERLTGVELGDIIEEMAEEQAIPCGDAWTDHVAGRFLAECVRRAPGARIRASRVYAFFREWYGRQDFPPDKAAPSMRSLNKRLCRAGFAKEKISWYMFHDLALGMGDAVSAGRA